jgi:hypothetical protein
VNNVIELNFPQENLRGTRFVRRRSNKTPRPSIQEVRRLGLLAFTAHLGSNYDRMAELLSAGPRVIECGVLKEQRFFSAVSEVRPLLWPFYGQTIQQQHESRTK